MAYTVDSFDDLLDLGRGLAQRLLPDHDTSEGSLIDRFVAIDAQMVADNHAHTVDAADGAIPDHARGDLADRWHGTIKGVPRKGATGARKSKALRLVGTVGATYSSSATLVHTSGLRYQLGESGAIPAAGVVDVDVYAIDTGSITRLNAGEVLQFEAAVAGIEVTAELQKDLDEDGYDAEQDGPYVDRALQRWREPALGGAGHDYRQWALEVLGVHEAYVYMLRGGKGTVDVAALKDASGTARVLSELERAELLEYIKARCPGTVDEVRVLSVTTAVQDVEVLVHPSGAASEFDWNDATPPVVSSWNAGTLTLTLSSARPSTMAANGRIVIATAGGLGEPITIESLPATTTQLVLERAPSVAPVAGDLVYAGGPLTAPCRTAVQALFDELGPANPDAKRYGEWEGNVRVLDIGRKVADVAGAYKPQVIVPAVDAIAEDPPWPNDGSVELLISRRILIRKRW